MLYWFSFLYTHDGNRSSGGKGHVFEFESLSFDFSNFDLLGHTLRQVFLHL